MVREMQPRRRSRVFGWWYVSIGVGFVLLGTNRMLMHGPFWTVGLRWLIAAGFFVLGWMEFRRSRQ